MIPIPKYLSEIAKLVESKSEKLTIEITCTCGSTHFWIYKNVPRPKGDKKLIQATEEWHKQNDHLFPHPPNNSYRHSENYFWIKNEVAKDGWYRRVYKAKDMPSGEPLEGAIPVHTWFFKKDEIPLRPGDPRLFMQDFSVIFKLKCASCTEEYLLFDNRIHGNDAVDFMPEELEEYDFKQRQVKAADGNPTEIHVTIRNYWDFNDVLQNGNEGLTADDYSNMFGHIIITAHIEGKKPVQIYSEDLG